MNPRVKSVTAMTGYRLRLIFDNGETGIYDCSPLLEFGVFKELKTPSYFQKAKIENGTVSWPNEQDICPDTLYEDSYKEKPPQNKKMHVTGYSQGSLAST
ncbi:MAG: DUF2442 domain-containing protein [Lentisphaeria bacterium]|nr:DUF2442 domain-containing protein [Lentisphaeria bacterium]